MGCAIKLTYFKPLWLKDATWYATTADSDVSQKAVTFHNPADRMCAVIMPLSLD